MKRLTICLMIFFLFTITGCSKDEIDTGTNADGQGHSEPTKITALKNREFGKELLFQDRKDFENAQQGLIARDSDLRLKNDHGEYIWNQPAYEFMQGAAPASVNPSLWRQGQLNNIHGLFKVTEAFYQIRGYDFANISMIRRSGYLIRGIRLLRLQSN